MKYAHLVEVSVVHKAERMGGQYIVGWLLSYFQDVADQPTPAESDDSFSIDTPAHVDRGSPQSPAQQFQQTTVQIP